jgi:hypothetical protein
MPSSPRIEHESGPGMTDVTEKRNETTNGAVPHPPAAPAAPVGGSRGRFDLNDRQKRVLLVVLVVHLILARFTLRDLRRRPESAVRGPKRLWRVWAATNTTGSLAYWTFGRRRGTTTPTA